MKKPLSKKRVMAGWALSGALVLAGQSSAQVSPRPTDQVVGPAVSTEFAPDALTRLEAIQIELAWLGDPVTFPYNLTVLPTGSAYVVRGYVPSEAVRAHALKLARAHTGRMVTDTVKIFPGVAVRMASEPPEMVQKLALDLVSQSLSDRGRTLTVRAKADGQVTVAGTVPCYEDKISVSRRLRSLRGCTSVANELTVVTVLKDGKLYHPITPDGSCRVPAHPEILHVNHSTPQTAASAKPSAGPSGPESWRAAGGAPRPQLPSTNGTAEPIESPTTLPPAPVAIAPVAAPMVGDLVPTPAIMLEPAVKQDTRVATSTSAKVTAPLVQTSFQDVPEQPSSPSAPSQGRASVTAIDRAAAPRVVVVKIRQTLPGSPIPVEREVPILLSGTDRMQATRPLFAEEAAALLAGSAAPPQAGTAPMVSPQPTEAPLVAPAPAPMPITKVMPPPSLMPQAQAMPVPSPAVTAAAIPPLPLNPPRSLAPTNTPTPAERAPASRTVSTVPPPPVPPVVTNSAAAPLVNPRDRQTVPAGSNAAATEPARTAPVVLPVTRAEPEPVANMAPRLPIIETAPAPALPAKQPATALPVITTGAATTPSSQTKPLPTILNGSVPKQAPILPVIATGTALPTPSPVPSGRASEKPSSTRQDNSPDTMLEASRDDKPTEAPKGPSTPPQLLPAEWISAPEPIAAPKVSPKEAEPISEAQKEPTPETPVAPTIAPPQLAPTSWSASPEPIPAPRESPKEAEQPKAQNDLTLETPVGPTAPPPALLPAAWLPAPEPTAPATESSRPAIQAKAPYVTTGVVTIAEPENKPVRPTMLLENQRSYVAKGTVTFAPETPAPAKPYVSRGVVTFEVEPPPPPAVPQPAKKLTPAQLRSRIETVCKGAVRDIQISVQPDNRLRILVKIPLTVDPHSLSEKILTIPELSSYNVSLEVVLLP